MFNNSCICFKTLNLNKISIWKNVLENNYNNDKLLIYFFKKCCFLNWIYIGAFSTHYLPTSYRVIFMIVP